MATKQKADPLRLQIDEPGSLQTLQSVESVDLDQFAAAVVPLQMGFVPRSPDQMELVVDHQRRCIRAIANMIVFTLLFHRKVTVVELHCGQTLLAV